MAKARSKAKQKPKPKGHAKAPETSSFALSRGWLAAETLVVPAATLLLVFVVLARFAGTGWGAAQIGIVAALVAIRLPMLVYTLARDPRIVLGKDELHVPNVGVFQLRAWNIPYAQLASIHETRKAGSAAKIVIRLRSGRTLRFAASVLKDRGTVIKAIERRQDAA